MSQTTQSTKPTQRTTDFRQKYKTQRCRYWYDRGWCPFNEFCAFAHAESELRDKYTLNHQYKTKICTNFKDHGFCKYGERCQFLHLNEAPTVLSRPSAAKPLVINTNDQKISQNQDKLDQEKHQKEITALQNFGLDILNMYLNGQQARKKGVGKNGEYLWSKVPRRSRTNVAMDFQSEFPDYNFSRKPRLGSL